MSTRTSPAFEGAFGRMFRLPRAAQFGEGEEENLENLAALGKAMAAAPDAPKDGTDEEESGIPALYTYLGQFIDHDLTFDPASSLQKQNDPDALVDYRTPAFDLDCVYGRGPGDQPYLYDGDLAPTRVRYTGIMHAATPRSAPGAKTITTRELVELYKGSTLVLINVLDWTEGAFALPGTVWIQGMGKAQLSGSEYLELRSLLTQVAPDKSAPLGVYCLSWECRLSYNAVLTASDLGYTNLYWYRGGISAWNQARLPVVRTKLLKQF